MSDIVLYKYLFFNHSYLYEIAKFATFEHWHNQNIGLQGKFTSCSLTDALEKIANLTISQSLQISPRIVDRHILASEGGDHE